MNDLTQFIPRTPEALTIETVADLTAKYIEFKGEQERWRARLKAIEMTMEKHGQTEKATIQERKVAAELARYTIEALVKAGHPEAALETFRSFSAQSPDFLGAMINILSSYKK